MVLSRRVVSRQACWLGVWGALALVWVCGDSGRVSADGGVEPQLVGDQLVDALQAGGLVILMRHMSTDDYVPDDGSHVDEECATQRNLDERGRSEARAVGEAFKTLQISAGPVLSSPYCRCIETGELAFGSVIEKEELAVFDELSGAEKDARGKLIRDMLNTPPPKGSNTVIITHTGSLLYAFGLQTRPEGLSHVFRPAMFGPATYVGRVSPAEWSRLAGFAAPTPGS